MEVSPQAIEVNPPSSYQDGQPNSPSLSSEKDEKASPRIEGNSQPHSPSEVKLGWGTSDSPEALEEDLRHQNRELLKTQKEREEQRLQLEKMKACWQKRKAWLDSEINRMKADKERLERETTLFRSEHHYLQINFKRCLDS